MEYLIVKWLHILSSTILFGTGIGSAYYMFFSSLSRDANRIAPVVRLVVIADWVFTTPTVILQPATGLYLVHLLGLPLESRWLLWSIALIFWREPLGYRSGGCRSRCATWRRSRQARSPSFPPSTGRTFVSGRPSGSSRSLHW